MAKRPFIDGGVALGGIGLTATDIDCSKGRYFSLECPAGNIILTVKNLPFGQCASVNVKQDATGGRTITWSSGGTTQSQTVGSPVAGNLQPAAGAAAFTNFQLQGSAQ